TISSLITIFVFVTGIPDLRKLKNEVYRSEMKISTPLSQTQTTSIPSSPQPDTREIASTATTVPQSGSKAVPTKKSSVPGEEASEARSTGLTQHKLEAEQEQLRQQQEKLQSGGSTPGTQVAVGLYTPSAAPKTLRNSMGIEFLLIQA